jgi:DNA-binding MarR family transcriptional regulator
LDSAVLEDAERVRVALSDLIRVAQFRDRDRVCCYDVSVSQCHALESLVDHGTATVNDLASSLCLDKSTASRLANALVQKGYVRRVAHVEDGRSVVLEPTARAKRLVERIRWELSAEYIDLLSEFDAEVRGSVATMVTRLAAAFRSRVDASGGTCCVVR